MIFTCLILEWIKAGINHLQVIKHDLFFKPKSILSKSLPCLIDTLNKVYHPLPSSFLWTPVTYVILLLFMAVFNIKKRKCVISATSGNNANIIHHHILLGCLSINSNSGFCKVGGGTLRYNTLDGLENHKSQ